MTSALSVICPRCGHHHDVTPASLLLFRELLEATKARGCALALRGETKPEGWPFAVLLAISKPGGEAAVELVEQAAARLSELTTVEVAT